MFDHKQQFSSEFAIKAARSLKIIFYTNKRGKEQIVNFNVDDG